MRSLTHFHQSFGKPQNWDFNGIFSSKVESLSFIEELCVMTIKNDAKFEEELTCRLKIDIRNLTNFDPSTQKPQTFIL